MTRQDIIDEAIRRAVVDSPGRSFDEHIAATVRAMKSEDLDDVRRLVDNINSASTGNKATESAG